MDCTYRTYILLSNEPLIAPKNRKMLFRGPNKVMHIFKIIFKIQPENIRIRLKYYQQHILL